MGCSSSKPELDSDSIYADRMKAGVEGLTISEELMIFSSSEEDDKAAAVDETKKLTHVPPSLKNYRNVVSWLPNSSQDTGAIKGIIVIAHGVLGHAQSHHKEGCAYAKAGYAVYAMDHVGHGLSSGIHGRVDSWESCVEDYVCFVDSMKAKHPVGTPVIMYGHSFGSLVTLLAAKSVTNLKAVITSGCPYIAGPGSASLFGCACLYPLSQWSFIAKVGACMAFIDPMGPTAPLYAEEVTGDPELVKANERDPRRRHMWMINSTATTTLTMIDQLKYTSVLADIKVPTFVAHGKDDTICYAKGSMEVFTKLGTPNNEKEVHLIPGLKHEICSDVEPRSTAILEDMVKFAQKHMGSVAAAASSGTEGISTDVEGVRRLRAATEVELKTMLATK